MKQLCFGVWFLSSFKLGALLWTCLDVSEQFGEVKLPLLTEAGKLQQEADCVVRLVQTRQTLHCPHCVQTLSTRGQEDMMIDKRPLLIST